MVTDFKKGDCKTEADRIDGVGVLRCPPQDVHRVAKEIAGEIRKGMVLVLPNLYDDRGNYAWDFRIEGGDPGQVVVQHDAVDQPTVVERT